MPLRAGMLPNRRSRFRTGAALSWLIRSWPSIGLIGVWALVGCHVYDAGKLEPQAGVTGGGSGRGGASGQGGDGADEDGGTAGDSGRCVERRSEICNLLDDDCDGDTDEDTEELCAMSFPNVASAECVEIRRDNRREALCVQRDCKEGFFNCDGNPSNGCEPYCMCHVCPDDDAGTDADAGQ